MSNINYNNIKFQTISMLPQVEANSTISDGSLFEIAIKNNSSESNFEFSSRSISLDRLTNHIIDKTIINFETKFNLETGDTSTNFKYLTDGVDSYLNGSKETVTGEHIFAIPPTINSSILDDFEVNSNKVATIATISAFSTNYNPLFLSKNGSFKTEYFNIETQERLVEDKIDNAPSTEMEKHNAFIFRMVGTQSTDTWKCPKSGWFMCYGWVDEESRDNNHSVSRWVALEGKFIDNGKEFWKILQFFPIVANTSQAQYCSYVTFSLPVQEGLELRLRSGFKVGTNSGLYWNIRGSMTSHIANAFVGGIYSGFSS